MLHFKFRVRRITLKIQSALPVSPACCMKSGAGWWISESLSTKAAQTEQIWAHKSAEHIEPTEKVKVYVSKNHTTYFEHPKRYDVRKRFLGFPKDMLQRTPELGSTRNSAIHTIRVLTPGTTRVKLLNFSMFVHPILVFDAKVPSQVVEAKGLESNLSDVVPICTHWNGCLLPIYPGALKIFFRLFNHQADLHDCHFPVRLGYIKQ